MCCCYIRNSTVTFSFFQNGVETSFSAESFRAIASHGICTEYVPWRFPAIVMRVRRRTQEESGIHDEDNNNINAPNSGRLATALLFRSGRVVMTGVSASSHCLRSSIRSMSGRVRRRVQLSLRAAGHASVAQALSIRRLLVRNLVSTVRVPFRVSVERLYDTLLRWDSGRPIGTTQFCGILRCRLDFCIFAALRCTLGMAAPPCQGQPPVAVTCLVFNSGRVIITGVRQVEQMEQAIHNVSLLLDNYRR